jgi:hypothetical protein
MEDRMSAPYITPADLDLDRRAMNGDREAFAQIRSDAHEGIAAEYRDAWLAGKWEKRVSAYRGDEPLQALISEALWDADEGPLRAVLELVREQANAGNVKALAIINRMAEAHAEVTTELRGI